MLGLVVILAVNVASVWADFFNPNPPVAGQAFTISGESLNPGAGGNWAVYQIGCGAGSPVASGLDFGPFPGFFTDSISPLHAGTYYFLHLGDSTGCTGSGSSGFTVQPASPTTTVTCLTSTLDVGGSTTCTATVSNAACFPTGNCGTPLPTTESVSWSDSGSVSFSSPTCTLSGTSCSVTVTGTSAGPASVKGSYSGDSDNDPSSGTFPLTINSTTPIPEYPLGLPLLALLTLIAYGLIRRRTRN